MFKIIIISVMKMLIQTVVYAIVGAFIGLFYWTILLTNDGIALTRAIEGNGGDERSKLIAVSILGSLLGCGLSIGKTLLSSLERYSHSQLARP